MKNTDKNANLHITAKIQNLDNLIDFTEKFMQKNGFDNKSIMQISIVAEEIFTNICNYGQLADGDIIKIDARMECDSKCVICFADGADVYLSEYEKAFECLWKRYYRSVNIKERPHEKQMKGYMPVRYWKFLPEKDGHDPRQ